MGLHYEVEYTDQFGEWWETLDENEQASVDVHVLLLEERGAQLPFPYSSGIEGSKYDEMRELRIQHKGDPYRVLYAFDPRRCALLLIGGNKKGKGNRWYKEFIPIADRIFAEHLKSLKKKN